MRVNAMALIKCHECGNEVSTEARSCPRCGAPPKLNEASDQHSVAKTTKENSNSIGRAFAFFGILGVIAVVMVSCNTDSDAPKSPEPKSQASSKPAECAAADLKCLGDRAVISAGILCKSPIERLAKYSVRWTDGTFDMKFSRFRWLNQQTGTITLIGDKVEFQNGFGAFSPMVYECDLSSDRKTVLKVRISEGRL